MDRAQLLVAVLGLIAGLALIPIYEGAHHWIVRVWNPLGGSSARLLLIMLSATVVACVAASVLILVPGYLIGVIPLREKAPYFFWSFAVGALTTRGIIEWRKRRKKAFL